MNIQSNILRIKSTLPEGVRLIAISKFHPIDALQQAYDAGQRIFGESHAQEVVGKHEALPKDIEWHFVGHLQTNKIKYIAPFISLIHSVDSLRLLREIDKQAAKCGRIIDCLLQLHIAQEETKFGFTTDELQTMLATDEYRMLQHVRTVGIMCMATNTDDEAQIRREFRQAKTVFDTIKATHFADTPHFREISMGMSDDYPIAIAEGSTMVRVGSSIFGEREYPPLQ